MNFSLSFWHWTPCFSTLCSFQRCLIVKSCLRNSFVSWILISWISIHICVTLQHVPVIEDFLSDLKESVQTVSTNYKTVFDWSLPWSWVLYTLLWCSFPYSDSGKAKPRSDKRRTCSDIWRSREDAWQGNGTGVAGEFHGWYMLVGFQSTPELVVFFFFYQFVMFTAAVLSGCGFCLFAVIVF